jgi:DNA-binding CsgD family transcriptional regulator
LESIISELPSICFSCHQRDNCSTLCPEAQIFAAQDEVRQKEINIGIPAFARQIETITPAPKLTLRERQIYFLSIGLSRREICRTLNINPGNLRKQLQSLRRKVNIDF